MFPVYVTDMLTCCEDSSHSFNFSNQNILLVIHFKTVAPLLLNNVSDVLKHTSIIHAYYCKVRDAFSLMTRFSFMAICLLQDLGVFISSDNHM